MSLNQNVTQEISLTGDALGHEFGCQDYGHVKLIGVVLAKKSWVDGLMDSNEELLALLEEARRTLEMWKDVAPAVSLCADIDKLIAKARGEK